MIDNYAKTIRMPQSLFDLWIAGLRSGKFAQGKMRLATKVIGSEEQYCCLGVLQKVVDGDVERYQNNTRNNGALTMPSESWCAKKGITFNNTTLTAGRLKQDPIWELPSLGEVRPSRLSHEKVIGTCSVANDSLNKTFDEIADLLERHVEVY